jgi:hypothetical protein
MSFPPTAYRPFGGTMRKSAIALTAVLVAATTLRALSAQAAANYQIRVTCSVPKSQPERQLAPNSCLNYLPDGTQTYVAHVTEEQWPTGRRSERPVDRLRRQGRAHPASPGHLRHRLGRDLPGRGEGHQPQAQGEDHRHRDRGRLLGHGLPDVQVDGPTLGLPHARAACGRPVTGRDQSSALRDLALLRGWRGVWAGRGGIGAPLTGPGCARRSGHAPWKGKA